MSMDQQTWRSHTANNQRAWDEIATARARWRHEQGMTAEFFASGGIRLPEAARAALGEVAGLRALHLQCATGEESLSLANLGAGVTAVDISPAQIEIARQTASAAGLPVTFVTADVLDLPSELRDGGFDLVYTATGVLPWLPDLTRWAETIAASLRSGGRLVLLEEHPLAACLWADEQGLRIESDYFGRNHPHHDTGWAHFPGANDATETKSQFHWPLGDTISHLIEAGLTITRLEEFPVDDGSSWRFGASIDLARRLPSSFLLTANRT